MWIHFIFLCIKVCVILPELTIRDRSDNVFLIMDQSLVYRRIHVLREQENCSCDTWRENRWKLWRKSRATSFEDPFASSHKTSHILGNDRWSWDRSSIPEYRYDVRETHWWRITTSCLVCRDRTTWIEPSSYRFGPVWRQFRGWGWGGDVSFIWHMGGVYPYMGPSIPPQVFWLTKTDPSLLLLYSFFYCWTCSRPKYAWNIYPWISINQ